MKRFVFLSIFLSTVAFSSFAQESSLSEAVTKNRYGDNWFISVGGSVNILFAEQDKLKSPASRTKFGGQFSVGKWFNPQFGFRFNYNRGSLRGFNLVETPGNGVYLNPNDGDRSRWPFGGFPKGDYYNVPRITDKFTFTDSKDGEPGFWQDFTYSTATVDLMFNLSTLLRGHYYERAVLDVIPFAGVGLINAYNNQLTTPGFYYVVAKLGARFNFNVNQNWAIYLEPQINATGAEFDGYLGTALGDAVANLGLGIQYSFGKGFYSFENMALEEIEYLNHKVNENRSKIDKHQETLDKHGKRIEDLEKCCEDKNTTVTKTIRESELPDYIRFRLDSYVIEKSEQNKVKEMAAYLRNNPNSTISLTGYADRETGNPAHNLRLSKNRVQAVASELQKQGIDADRLSISWKGDTEQPFPQNEWNRVVLVIEDK
jgi:outer membrane protein OmpA-like peptidoglycan-associated protein